MNLKISTLCFICIFAPLCLFGQNFENYQPARCHGEVPQDFLLRSSEKASAAILAIQNKKIKGKDKRDEETYAVSSNFLVDELISSGQILFGDSMTTYINKIAEVLLESEPEVRKQLRFYVYRSTIPNAYATHTGIVLISIGLLARVDNESQIACILSHEIQHYLKKHSLQQFKKVNKLKRSLGKISRMQMDDRFKELYRFSKESESEADLLGFKLMQKTKYNLHEGLEVFKMLRYTEFPFLEISLPYDSFQTQYFKFPEETTKHISDVLEKKSQAEIDAEKDEDSENSTHPSLGKRITVLSDLLVSDNIPNTGNNFIVSEMVFKNMQRSARCELLLLNIRQSDFGKAIYLAQVMELVYGKTLFTDKIKAMGWYGLATHKLLNHGVENYGCDVTKAAGDWRPFMALPYSVKPKVLGVLAMRKLYMAASEHSDDKWFAELRDKVFLLAQKEEEIKLTDFLDYKPESKLIDSANSDTISKPSIPQIKNPKNREKKENRKDNKIWYNAAFYDLNTNSTLATYFEKIKYVKPEMAEVNANQTKKKRKQKDTPVVNSVAMFEPDYNRYNISGSGETKKLYFTEEETEASLSYKLQQFGKLAGMPVTVVSGSNSSNLTLDAINQYMILNDWFIERMNNDTNRMVLYNNQFAQPIMSDLGTDYLGWVGFRYTVSRHKFNAQAMVYTMILYPLFPAYLIWQLSHPKDFGYATIIFNTKNSAIQSVKSKELSHRLTNDFLNAQMYQLLYNIRNGK